MSAIGRNSLHDFTGHGGECLLDVGGVFGRSLQKGDSEAIGKLFGGVKVNDLLCGHITLVSNEEFVDVLAGIAVNFLQPLLDVAERCLVCDIVDDDDSVGSAIVAGGDGSEALLTGGIPLQRHTKTPTLTSVFFFLCFFMVGELYNLKLYGLSIEVDGSDFL